MTFLPGNICVPFTLGIRCILLLFLFQMSDFFLACYPHNLCSIFTGERLYSVYSRNPVHILLFCSQCSAASTCQRDLQVNIQHVTLMMSASLVLVIFKCSDVFLIRQFYPFFFSPYFFSLLSSFLFFVISYYSIPCKFFASVLTIFLPETERQQVSLGSQDSSKYSSQS